MTTRCAACLFQATCKGERDSADVTDLVAWAWVSGFAVAIGSARAQRVVILCAQHQKDLADWGDGFEALPDEQAAADAPAATAAPPLEHRACPHHLPGCEGTAKCIIPLVVPGQRRCAMGGPS